MRNSFRFLGLAAAFSLAGCVEEPDFDKPRSAMTQRERDSTIGTSGLPGSGVVRKAIDIADSEARRAAMLDSVSLP